MKMNDYQDFAGITANKDLDPIVDFAVLALGIAGEAGEVADLVKKIVGHGHDFDRKKFVKELGDVLWYVAVIAKKKGITLEEIADMNIKKLASRYPEGFSVEASKNRKPEDV